MDLSTTLFDSAFYELPTSIGGLLSKYEKDINAKDIEGKTLLFKVLQHKERIGQLRLIRLLLEHGADPNPITKDCNIPLYEASEEGYIEIVRLLLEHGANPNQGNHYGITPLFIASSIGHKDVVNLLLEHNVEVNYQFLNKEYAIYGATALYVAVEGKHIDIAKILLEHGADPYKAKYNGSSPIYLAAAYGYKDLVALMSKYKKQK